MLTASKDRDSIRPMTTTHPDDLPTITVPAIYQRSDTLTVAAAVSDATASMRETVERLTRENESLHATIASLRRELGTARLLADLRRDIAEFELSGDELPALLRPQA